ncbi:hypothetical protein [Arcobacter porcinus]|uniref:Molybdopterin-containing oxidoreductase I, DMSO/TMAO/BSO reductase family, monoheme c-type cytochrome n=1 Tax=Arcobacter porcinus TaxID=1935204 RepID=A0A5C2HKB1_9BACT|nr:hypothetical protein [Arcobacter porcinus]OCL96878.1 Cytochrome c-type protein TorY [Aliarcobacter thereius]QEP40708.1 molybdopterin-containing oxidoreductase I, DMSO/TMAO/BSO reductase family, monoheme c-type cytochrome [Arcobacter porcinus]
MKIIKIVLSLFFLTSFSYSNEMYLLENAKVEFDGKKGEILIGTPVKLIKDIDDKISLVEIDGFAIKNQFYSNNSKLLLMATNSDNFIKDSNELQAIKIEAKIEKSYLTSKIKDSWEEHEEFYYDMCSSCHAGHRAVTHTMLEWEAILQTMKGFAQLDDSETDYMLRYLKANAKDGFYKNNK